MAIWESFTFDGDRTPALSWSLPEGFGERIQASLDATRRHNDGVVAELARNGRQAAGFGSIVHELMHVGSDVVAPRSIRRELERALQDLGASSNIVDEVLHFSGHGAGGFPGTGLLGNSGSDAPETFGYRLQEVVELCGIDQCPDQENPSEFVLLLFEAGLEFVLGGRWLSSPLVRLPTGPAVSERLLLVALLAVLLKALQRWAGAADLISRRCAPDQLIRMSTRTLRGPSNEGRVMRPADTSGALLAA